MTEYFNTLRDEWIRMMCAAIEAKPLSGHEKGVADLLLKGLEDAGIECYRDEAGNVIGVLRGTGDGPVIMTNGHMDVVPEGNIDAWKGRDPFKGTVEDGRLYGRGSSDMLMGTVSAFFTIREFKKLLDRGMKMNGTLVFTGCVNEEPAESMGALHLLGTTLPKLGLTPDLVILGEPCEGGIYLGSRGKVELVVDVYGKVAHSSAPWQGISAVEKAMPVMEAIINNMYKKGRTHDKLGFSAMCITDVEVTPGRMYSCVPDKCSITIDRRYVPPTTIQDTIDEIREFLEFLAAKDPEFRAEVHQRMNTRTAYTGLTADVPKQHPAWMTDEDDPLVLECFAALKDLGYDLNPGYKVGGNDGSATRGIYGYPTISYSWGIISQCHQPGEYCIIDDEMKELEGLSAILCRLFGMDFEECFGSR